MTSYTHSHQSQNLLFFVLASPSPCLYLSSCLFWIPVYISSLIIRIHHVSIVFIYLPILDARCCSTVTALSLRDTPYSLLVIVTVLKMPLNTACIAASVTPTVLSTWTSHVSIICSKILHFNEAEILTNLEVSRQKVATSQTHCSHLLPRRSTRRACFP